MSLKDTAIAATKWTGISSFISVVINFIQISVLAKFLAPADFGLMAMIMVVIGFAQIYSDMGISNAIIHRQNINEVQLSTLYWLNILTGIAVFIILLSCVELIVWFYDEPAIAEYVYWSLLVFLIIPFGQQFQILLQKHMKFKWLAIIDFFSLGTGMVVSIVLAYYRYGIYALIGGQLSGVIVRTFMLIILGIRNWRPKMTFQLDGLSGYFGFGLYQMGEKSINYFNMNMDRLIIGAMTGSQALGYYVMAYNLVLQPILKINPIITRVAYPVFSKIQHDHAQLMRGYLAVSRILSIINFPLLIGLCIAAPYFVVVVLGEKWSLITPLIQILCFVALLRSAGNPIGSLLLAKGRADLGFKWNIFVLAIQTIGITGAAYLGDLYTIAYVLLFLHIIYFCLSYKLLVFPLLGPCLNIYARCFLLPFAAAVFMAAAIFCMTRLMPLLEPFWMLLLQVIAGGLIYILMVFIFMKDDFFQINNAIGIFRINNNKIS